MVINFPLTEGKKKDKEHKMHKDRADYQAFKAGLPVWGGATHDARRVGDFHGQGNGGVAWRETGLVVLPHFQGIGLGTKVPEIVAARCGALGFRLMPKRITLDLEGCRACLYFGHTWHNGVALCGNPAACILARWERGAGGDPEGVKKRWARTDFRDCGAGDLPRDVRTVRKVSKERFSRMWSSRPSHWDWVR